MPEAPRASVRIFRWKAVAPLLVCSALAALGWLLFADRVARRGLEAAGTALVGGRVEIRRLHVDLVNGNVAISGLTVASPHEPFQNLFEADELVADLDLLPLLEKKVVIDRLAANGLRFGTPRRTDGRTLKDSAGGPADGVRREVTEWASRIPVPALQLATGKIDVGTLDPANLSIVGAAEAVSGRADSSWLAWQAQIDSLQLGPTVDSGLATLQRLRGARATDLATLRAARRAVEQLQRARDRVTALERSVAGGVAALQQGVTGLEAARQRDYAFARGLLKLPSLDAPDIGAALFGAVAVGKFERALYWARLAREYMPPGLLPRADAGPRRARRAGLTVRFPRERAYPAFLLRDAEVSFTLGAATDRPRDYAGRLTGLTSSPALYGRPTTFSATAPAVRIGAVLDHVRGTPEDTAAATIDGVSLPALALPSLPVRLDPGQGTVALSFALKGDSLRAHWGVRSSAVRWVRDSAAPAGSEIEQMVWRVLSGIPTLDLSTELGGTLASPRLSVRSNLDDAIAQRLRAMVGEEVAVAERRLRAEVDRVVEERAAPVRARVAAATSGVNDRLAEQKGRLEQTQQDLERRLREVARGIRLP